MSHASQAGRKMRHLGVVLAATLGLGACATQQVPTEELREQALEHTQAPGQWRAGAAGAGPVRDTWLQQFSDPQLEQIVIEAMLHNTDMRVAAARVEQAAAYVKASGAQLLPTVSVIGSTGSKSGTNGGTDLGAITAAWELDLWGRMRAARNASFKQYSSTAYDLYYARQSLAALVVKSWYTATEAWQQRQLAEETARAAGDLLKLAQDRLRIGAGDARDVAIAQANLNLAQDKAQQLDQSYTTALRALEVLLGRYPAAEIEVPRVLPTAFAPVPAGLPAELLERRPDVIAAERRVAAAFHRTEEAKTARLPSVSLTAGVSWVSSDLFVLQEDHENPTGSLGIRLLAPLYQGGALQAQVEIRTAEQKQAVAEYAGVALKAFSDVENALNGEQILGRREPLLAESVRENERALTLSETQYRVGKIDLRAVRSQQIDLYQARMQWLRLQNERIAQRVNLYLALGGDFGG